MQNIPTKIYRYLMKKVEIEDLIVFHKKLGITKTRFTQLMKRPKSATNELLIALSFELQIDPFTLYKEYEIAKSTLTETEVKFYENYNRLIKLKKKLA